MAKRRHVNTDQRRMLWEQMNRRCAYCGMKIGLSEVTIDHKVPLSRGGADSLDNMLCSCGGCNQFKRDMTIEEFREIMMDNNLQLMNRDPAFRAGVRFGSIKIYYRKYIRFYFEKKSARNHGINRSYRCGQSFNADKDHKRKQHSVQRI